VTATAEQYTTAAELLRRLIGRPDRLPCDDGDPATLTDALEVAARACEQIDEADVARVVAEQECEEAMLEAAHLWSLLERAAEAVDARLAHDNGAGTWETVALAYELRQALDEEPADLGARLLGELHAARVALRVASGLDAAVHRGDGTAVRQCLATFQQARRAWQTAAGTRRAAGEVDMTAGAKPR